MSRQQRPWPFQSIMVLDGRIFPQNVKGDALIIGPNGTNAKYLQQETKTGFSVRTTNHSSSNITMDIRYTEPSDLMNLEIMINKLALASQTGSGNVEAQKMRLPELSQEQENGLRMKWRPFIEGTGPAPCPLQTTKNHSNQQPRPRISTPPPPPEHIRRSNELHQLPAAARGEIDSFYGALSYPSVVPEKEVHKFRFHSIPLIKQQRNNPPSSHAEFVFNCHLLAVVCHGLLTYKNFEQYYLDVFKYRVTSNVTLHKLLNRYPSVISYVNMNVRDDFGIQAINPYTITMDDVFRKIASDDWNDANCPSHIKKFWNQERYIHYLPRSKDGDTPIVSAPHIALTGGPPGRHVSPHQGRPSIGPPAGPPTPPWKADGSMRPIMKQPGMSTVAEYQRGNSPHPHIVYDPLLEHPVALTIQGIHHILGADSEYRKTHQNVAEILDLNEATLAINEFVVPPRRTGGILSLMSNFSLDGGREGRCGYGHIENIIGHAYPFDDGGGLLSMKHQDLTTFFQKLNPIFDLQYNQQEIIGVKSNVGVDLTKVLPKLLLSLGFSHTK